VLSVLTSVHSVANGVFLDKFTLYTVPTPLHVAPSSTALHHGKS
jgi:hypothetical protein